MKKITILLLSLILSMSNLGLSICLGAEDKPNPWVIESYTAFADVKPDGSMVIEEYITYKFSKGFTGALKRHIDTFASSGVEDLSIFDLVEADNEDISKSKLEKIDPDSYEIILDKEYGMLEEIDIYLESGAKQRTLVYKYTLNDLVGLYKDMALLEWTFLNEDDSQSLDNIKINISVPKSSDMETIKPFLLGPLYSQQVNVDKTIIAFEGHRMIKDHDLEIVMLLPISVIPEGRKRIDNEITQSVLYYMEGYEKEIVVLRKEYESRQLVIKLLTYVTAGIIVISMIYLFLKHGKDPDVASKLVFSPKLPADYYTPAELGVFMNRGRVKPDYIIASLMNLVKKGYLNAKPAEESGFILSRNPDARPDQLKGHEEYLLVWFFDDIGHGASEVSTKRFEEWIKDPQMDKRYRYKFKTWTELVTKQASKWKFFEDIGKAKIYGISIGALSLIPGTALCILGEWVSGIANIILSLSLIIYSLCIRKRTEFGAINYRQWIAFKSYIKKSSQSSFPKLEPEEWEKFLPYAIPLGIAREALEKFHKLYDDKELKDNRLLLLQKKDLDKTLYWISSMVRENRLKDRLSGVFNLFNFNPFTIDKKG